MSKFKDLTGLKFGRLTVQFLYDRAIYGKFIWHCKCECGTEVNVFGCHLSNGRTKSCGCYQKEMASEASRSDLVGRQFGRLTVVSFSRMANRHNSMWWCICSCDNHTRVEVLGCNLVKGTTTSCGCYRIEMAIKRATTHGMRKTKEYERIKSHRRREKERKLDGGWTVDMEIALREFFSRCVLCDGLDNLSTDHVRPLNLGYGLEPGNAIILCEHCNASKQDKMPEELSLEKCRVLLDAAESFRSQWMD